MKELAQLKVPGYDQPIQAPSGIPSPTTTTPDNILNWVIGILLAVAVIAAVGFLIWGGITWITSGGDKQKVAKARGTVIAAIIGLVIVILSFVIISFVGNVLDVRSLQGR